MKRRLFMLVLAICIVLGLATAVTATDSGTITVTGITVTDTSSLDAVLKAVNADTTETAVTITLPAGTYSVTANEACKITRNNVTLQGAGIDQTTIDYGAYSCSGQAGLLIAGDNVTVKDLTVTSNTDNAGVSSVKVTKVDVTGKVANTTIENVKIISRKSHGLNLHGVTGATVKNVTTTGGKCGISLAQADVTISGTNATGGWASVGMMYGNSDAYAEPVTLTLGEGNTMTGIYTERTDDKVDTININAAVTGLTGIQATKSVKINTAADVTPPTTNAVAETGNVYYQSVQAAVAAANGGTVKLVDDISSDARVLTVDKGVTVTLDLNGHDITSSYDPYTISVEKGGNLTIIGEGTINNTSAGSTTVRNYGTLTIGELGEDGPTITRGETTNNAGNSAVKCEEESTLVINSGTFGGDKRSIQTWGATTINGGTFEKSVEAWAWAGYQSSLKINNGVFKGNLKTGVDEPVDNNTAKITIYGGTFTVKPSEDYLAAGLDYTTDGQGNTTVAIKAYNVTVKESANGEVVADVATAKPTDIVTLTVTPAEGYELDTLKVNGEAVENGKFVMPEKDAVVEATFKKAVYQINLVVTGDGTAKVNKETASMGDEVILTVEEKDGYDWTLEANVKIDSETGKFTMPAANVNITVTFKETSGEGGAVPEEPCDGKDDCPCLKFEDLDPTEWYHEAVDFVLEIGIMEGDGTKEFKPNDTLSRAMMVQMLYKMDDKPEATIDNPYTDVEDDAWYTPAILWATENGIVEGHGDKTFTPDAAVTREQMAAILHRYADYLGISASTAGDLDEFDDADKASDWAVEDLEWAIGAGIFEGNGDGTINPVGTAKRSEAAKVLYEFCINILIGEE